MEQKQNDSCRIQKSFVKCLKTLFTCLVYWAQIILRVFFGFNIRLMTRAPLKTKIFNDFNFKSGKA